MLAALVLVVGISFAPRAVSAQEGVWVQIEAQPSRAEAIAAARNYARSLPDVASFSLGGGWYGIALGPYTRAEADRVLRAFRAGGEIPRDSYIAFSSGFRSQIWPSGDSLIGAAPETPEAVDEPAVTTARALADETPQEARASERLLSRAEREELQIALRWAGVYNAGIDGAFGRGTRSAMGAWQDNNGYEATGVLTTRQRAELLGQYNAVLDGMALGTVTSAEAGIAIPMPRGAVRAGSINPPFVLYGPTGLVPEAQVILISQSGSAATLAGLYDILQTLEIMPLEGDRDLDRDDFTVTGANDRIVSHAEARLQGGEIKGFILVWPAGDEDRRTRILAEMQKGFARLGGVLDPAAGEAATQDLNLLSGLEIRQPRMTRSGFYIDGDGTVVTTSDIAEAACTRLTLDGEHMMTASVTDGGLGLAVLRPESRLAPLASATFRQTKPRLQSEVAVAGYSYGGVLGAPTLTFGTMADVRGLRGEPEISRLTLAALPGDAGGPVFDGTGRVLGMLLPRADGTGRQLPDDVQFAADSGAIAARLRESGLTVAEEDATDSMHPVDLTDLATSMTVLVSCWD